MRARTTALATAVVAVALVVAGLVVLEVLRHNLVNSASLQAEVTARDVVTQIAIGTDFPQLKLPDSDSQPVQVVSADRRILAADDDLQSRPMADFTPTSVPAATDDDDDDDDETELVSTAGTTAVATFRDVRLPVGDDEIMNQVFRVAAIGTTTVGGQPVTVYAGASLDSAQNAVADVRKAMLTGLPVLLLVVAVVTWLVTRRALRPVEAIRSELAEIMGGDLSRRVPEPAARDEIARLAATTNATLAALEESAERQRRFIADAAHELRSPIASLRAQLEVARAHPRLLELDGLIGDTIRLEHLAADLLLLARLDAGEQPRSERVELAALIHDELARRIGDRLPVDTVIPDDSVAVTGSRTQLARVLGNLVDNAQRHAATTVRVSLERTVDHMVVLAVADDGRGVPAADRDRIFQRFVRLDDARSRDEGGAGLGLAIVADVVNRHAGRIRVGDSADGGARFIVTLPAWRSG
ncbi:HAMP domain-containing histidine kinase [Nocardia vinacea]|uniref:histidine kinase n=1 Tax=Nocardia vinacea TaxID=96468 RepID=A0ABZ1YJK3_9NOCA|nr:HAMP domain-containing sensor histidine kinase [Nocardia vinacea]